MKEPEPCPLCGHEMDHHVYHGDDERTYDLYYCPMCECDYGRSARHTSRNRYHE